MTINTSFPDMFTQDREGGMDTEFINPLHLP